MFFFLFAYPTYAQYTLEGTVRYGNEPIGFARVYAEEDEEILSYVFTDSLGRFSLTFSAAKDSVRLAVDRLGYRPFQKVIARDQKTIGVQLALADKSRLSEVVIKGGKPVEIQGDTLNYLIAPFSDGSEKYVEDLLAKLPGVSVDESSGTIRYQGKEIKKILLDGDDLTGDNYKVLSKNLSADWLEEVEIVKRFTGSRLLQGIKQSRDVAINLKLKENAKAPLFGAIELGAGNARYAAKAELLSYLKKVKLVALGAVNNTGNDLQEYDIKTYAETQEYNGFILTEPWLNNRLTPPPFLRAERFTFHQGQFFSNSAAVKLSPKSSLRSLTTVYNNDIHFNFFDSLYYPLPSGDNLSFTRSRKQQQQPFEVFQDIKAENQLSSHQDLIVRFQYTYSTDRPISKNTTGLSALADRSKINKNRWFGGLSYLHKFRSNWVNTLNVEAGNDRLAERFTLSKENASTDSIVQTTDQDFFNLNIFNQLNGVIKKSWYASFFAGWSRNDSDLSFANDPRANTNSFRKPYRFDHLFAELKLEKKFKIIRLSAGGRLRNASVKYDSRLSNRVYVEPTLSAVAAKTLGKIDVEARGLYNIEYIFLKPYQLIDRPFFSDYRTAIAFASSPDIPNKNEIGIASLKLTENNISFLSAHAEWVYLKSSSMLTSQMRFIGDAVTVNRLQNGVSKNFFSAYSIDKYFSKIRSTVKVAYSYNESAVPLTIEGEPGDNRLQESILSVTSGSSISKQITVSMALKRHVSTNKWGGEKTSFSFMSYLFKVIYKPLASLRAVVAYRGINFRDTGNYGDMLNASIDYSLKEDKVSISITGNNLLNRRALVLSNLESSLFTNSSYPLQPWFFLLSVKYRF